MRRTTRLAALAVGLSAVLGSLPAQAQNWQMIYDPTVGWSDGSNNHQPPARCDDLRGFAHLADHTMYWYLNPGGQGAGKEGAIQGALQAWTDVGNADFDLSWGGYTYSGYQQTDGINTMVWGIDGVCDTNSCHAITGLLLESGQVIREADILFNANSNRAFQWMTNGEYNLNPPCWQTAGSWGLKLDTQGIATHELGHAIGIFHPTNHESSYATMGIRACTTDARTLEWDDIDALRCSENRYPAYPAYQGALESVGCQTIRGWAWNANRSYQQSYVEVVEDFFNGSPTELHGITQAFLYRPDLGLPDPFHGFELNTPSTLRDGQWHLVRGRYSGNGANVGNSHLMVCGLEMFPRSMNPSDYLSTNGDAYEVGTTFTSDYPGYITHIGYHFAPNEWQASSHTVKLWGPNGEPLASAPIYPPTVFLQFGWNVAEIGRVPIQANVQYRASVDTYINQSKSPCGSPNSLASPYSNYPLTALGGVWRAGVGQPPDVGSCSNFFVSVTYESG